MNNVLFTPSKYINEIVNFKELEFIIFYIKLFFVLKINYLYANYVILHTHNIFFIFVFKHNYINIYVKDGIDLLNEFKLSTCNLYSEIIRDEYIFKS